MQISMFDGAKPFKINKPIDFADNKSEAEAKLKELQK